MLVFQLVGLLSAWALLCLLVYGALRLFGRRFPLALCSFGAIALGLWCMVFGGYIVGNITVGNIGGGSTPYPFALVGRVGATLLLTMSVGGAILSYATQKQLNWLQGVLFCGLYLAAIHGLTAFALVGSSPSQSIWMAHFAGSLSGSWNQLLRPMRITSWGDEYFSSLSLFLVWIFPLGVPLLETIFHSFKRALKTNRTGSLV